MQREIVRRFRDGRLLPTSSMMDVPHIGPYLFHRMKREFAPNRASFTLRMFASRIQSLTHQQIAHRLQRALQNRRNNQCVPTQSPTTNNGMYHVADYNLHGYKAIVSLVQVMASHRDGHNLGRNFTFDARRLRATHRDHDSKYVPCMSRARCTGIWYDRMCQPSAQTRGFPGVAGRTGQKFASNKLRRGQYAKSPQGGRTWRRPRRMVKV